MELFYFQIMKLNVRSEFWNQEMKLLMRQEIMIPIKGNYVMLYNIIYIIMLLIVKDECDL